MSKRFTDSTKWASKPWFRRLPPVAKCLWLYMCDSCDVAGVIRLDAEFASFVIGETVTDEHLKLMGKQVEEISPGLFWIVDFVQFQYGKLSPDCRPHKKIIDTLKGYHIKGYSKGINTLMDRVQDKDKDKDKEEDKDKEGCKEGRKADGKSFIPPTVEEVADYCKDRKNAIDPETFVGFYASKGWMIGKNKMKDWRAAVLTWEKQRSNAGSIQPALPGGLAIGQHLPPDYDFEAGKGKWFKEDTSF
jgi:hypothetical protein